MTTLSKALDLIAEDHPHLDTDDYLQVESLNSGIDEEMDDFMDDIQDLGYDVPGDSGEED
eukprot:5662833-Prymnesium_polylepis.1